MSVVGIDFGNLNTIVAVARNRGIDVIVNEVSNRTTPSLVSFGEKQRFLGEAAKTQEVSNFRNTIGSLKRIVGRPFSDPDILNIERKYVNCNLVETKEGQVAASIMYENEQREMTFTQLVAMYFTKIKEFTSKEIQLPVTDVVISCPGWFTDHQRRAIMDAAEIAQLNCLRVMNDLTAAALGYGITKTDLPDEATDPKAKPKIVCFVDMGHSSYQVAIVAFTKGKLVVKSTAYDRNLGGRNFDDVLIDHYTKEFSQKYKMDIASNKKAVYRMRVGCERVKKILSANAMTVLNIECLMDDKDVSVQVQRSDFEEWIQPLLSRLTAPLEEAIAQAGVTVDDIDAVELIGGSIRVPIVKETLAKFFGGSSVENSKLSTTLNQDEAVARGCALECAILSAPVFKVRDFSVTDWNAYPIQLSWDPSVIAPSKSGAVDSAMDAFPLGNVIPSTKMLTLSRILNEQELAAKGGAVTLDISAAYTDEVFVHGAPTGHGKHIGTWTIKGIKPIEAKEGEVIEVGPVPKATIKVKAKLTGNDIVSIEDAHQIEDVTVTYTEQVPKKKTEEKKEESKTEGDAMDTSEDKKKEPETETVTKTKKVTRKYPLEIVAVTSSLPRTTMSELQAAEGRMYAADRLVIDTAEKRNALEEYVYDVRSKLEMAWSDFVADDVRSAFMNQLNDTESWLYSIEGEEATKSVYQDKLNELKKTGDPIAERAREAELRPLAERAFRDYVNGVIVSVTAGDDRYAHIAKEDMDKVTSECQNKLNWLNDSVAKQNQLSKHAPLAVKSAEINAQRDALYNVVSPILSQPKPAPKPEKKTEEKKKDTDAAQDDSKSDDTMSEETKEKTEKIQEETAEQAAMEVD